MAERHHIPISGIIVPNMGIRSSKLALSVPPGLASALFTPVQQTVLGLLFGQSGRRFQGNEIIRLADSGTGAVHRVLTKLAQVGLVTVERVGNQKYYQANADSPVFAELTGLVRKTVGLAGPLKDALAPLASEIELAFVYGSVARGTDSASSDIDLMVVSDRLDYPRLYAALQEAQTALARPVSPSLMSVDEWRRKIAQVDSFAARIAVLPKMLLIGSEASFAALTHAGN